MDTKKRKPMDSNICTRFEFIVIRRTQCRCQVLLLPSIRPLSTSSSSASSSLPPSLSPSSAVPWCRRPRQMTRRVPCGSIYRIILCIPSMGSPPARSWPPPVPSRCALLFCPPCRDPSLCCLGTSDPDALSARLASAIQCTSPPCTACPLCTACWPAQPAVGALLAAHTGLVLAVGHIGGRYAK